MGQLGRAILLLGLVVAVYGVGASVVGARTDRSQWVDSGRRAMYSLAGLMAIAFGLLESAFIRNDFSFKVVAQSSSSTIPTFYKLAAPWSSQQGSLLLWVTLLSVFSSVVLFITRHRLREIVPWATATLLGLATFFLSLAAFAANPFDTFAAGHVPAQGNGLDPLLMHPTMIIHPPMLYTGYTLMAVPFAFALGALISGRLGSEWIRDTRRFALAAWLCLGIGITLGARWSYTELGWGGYWAWDAVENAALMPWLMITAFIHSIQIQEKRGMLKVWNVSLVALSGILTIFGTFLVRSGVLDSIHAFGASTLGIPFVALLAVMLVGTVALIVYRLPQLRSEHQIDSLLSREAMFVLQNLVLVAMVFVIFWVTLFPLISEALTGTSISVGPPIFDRFVVPLAIVLALLTGVGPMISWRRATAANLRRHFSVPLAAGVLTALLAVTVLGTGIHPYATIMFAAGAFVITGVVQEIVRGAAARRASTLTSWPVALGSLLARNRRRYGGYIVHLGIAVLLIGVAASSSFKHSENVFLKPGASTTLDGYRFHYVRPTVALPQATGSGVENISLGAIVDVTRGGRHVVTLRTVRGIYPATSAALVDGVIGQYFDMSQADTSVGLDAGPLRDIWAVVQSQPTPLMQRLIIQGNQKFQAELAAIVKAAGPNFARETAALNRSGIWQLRDLAVRGIAEQYRLHPVPVQFLFEISPLVMWIWSGAIIVVLGALIALWPARLRRRPPVTAAPVRPSLREAELV
jgi:cytochrome c-type biogenesis protein CcmF